MKIRFIDCDHPELNEEEGFAFPRMIGTESSLSLVAEGLAARGHEVAVCQARRPATFTSGSGVRYLDFDPDHANPERENPDLVVTLRCDQMVKKIRQVFPGAALAHWAHECSGARRNNSLGSILLENKAHLLSASANLGSKLVSKARQTISFPAAVVRNHVIYNPIPDMVRPDPAIRTNPNKMATLRFPDDDLADVLDQYARVKLQHPELELHVIDIAPRESSPDGLPDGVVCLGVLPYQEILRHLQEAWCFFYPRSFAGDLIDRVFADANALGTPVLTHPSPTAWEMLNPADEQLIDCESFLLVALRVNCWKADGAPKVTLKRCFRLTQVLDRWECLGFLLMADLKADLGPKNPEIRLSLRSLNEVVPS